MYPSKINKLKHLKSLQNVRGLVREHTNEHFYKWFSLIENVIRQQLSIPMSEEWSEEDLEDFKRIKWDLQYSVEILTAYLPMIECKSKRLMFLECLRELSAKENITFPDDSYHPLD